MNNHSLPRPTRTVRIAALQQLRHIQYVLLEGCVLLPAAQELIEPIETFRDVPAPPCALRKVYVETAYSPMGQSLLTRRRKTFPQLGTHRKHTSTGLECEQRGLVSSWGFNFRLMHEGREEWKGGDEPEVLYVTPSVISKF